MARVPERPNSRERPVPGELHGEVGQRLRARREEQGLSLRELARRLGISPSAVSQIETGKSQPSVSTLYAMVTELGMSLDELFSERAADHSQPAPGVDPATRKARMDERSPTEAASEGQHVQRSATRMAIDLESGVRWERLTSHADPDADFLYVVYDVGGSSSRNDQFIRHAGREYGLVLRGTLEVTVGFDRYELGPGDSISFDSTVPHRLRNTGAEPVHGVWFVGGRQGDPRIRAFEQPESDRGG